MTRDNLFDILNKIIYIDAVQKLTDINFWHSGS